MHLEYNLTAGPLPKLNGADLTYCLRKMRLALHINGLISHAQSAFIK
jgi:hypothetical protein